MLFDAGLSGQCSWRLGRLHALNRCLVAPPFSVCHSLLQWALLKLEGLTMQDRLVLQRCEGWNTGQIQSKNDQLSAVKVFSVLEWIHGRQG